MDFIIELILEIFGFAVDEAMESKRVSLKAKIVVISVLCGIFTAASLCCSIYFGATKDFALCAVFAAITLLFIGLWIFGIKKQIKRHRK